MTSASIKSRSWFRSRSSTFRSSAVMLILSSSNVLNARSMIVQMSVKPCLTTAAGKEPFGSSSALTSGCVSMWCDLGPKYRLVSVALWIPTINTW